MLMFGLGSGFAKQQATNESTSNSSVMQQQQKTSGETGITKLSVAEPCEKVKGIKPATFKSHGHKKCPGKDPIDAKGNAKKKMNVSESKALEKAVPQKPSLTINSSNPAQGKDSAAKTPEPTENPRVVKSDEKKTTGPGKPSVEGIVKKPDVAVPSTKQ